MSRQQEGNERGAHLQGGTAWRRNWQGTGPTCLLRAASSGSAAVTVAIAASWFVAPPPHLAYARIYSGRWHVIKQMVAVKEKVARKLAAMPQAQA